MPEPLMVAVVELDEGRSTVIDPVVLHEENVQTDFSVADIESAPASFHTFVPDGVVVLALDGLTANDTLYWCSQKASSVIGLLMVTEGVCPVPE